MVNLIKIKSDVSILNEVVSHKNPSKVYLPLYNNKSFRSNDYIYKNTVVNDYVCPVSGRVLETKGFVIDNKIVKTLVVENDFKENSKNKNKKVRVKSLNDLLSVLDNNYLDSIKRKIISIKRINNLVISSIDEEDEINELVRLSNNYDEVIDTIDNLRGVLGLDNVTLAVKSTDFKSIQNVKSIMGIYLNMHLSLVPDKYLISYKEFLCKYLNYNPLETLVLTTNEVYNIYLACNGHDIDEKYVSIYGTGIDKGIIVSTKLYCCVSELLNDLDITYDNKCVMYINGSLGGVRISNPEKTLITSSVNSIVINLEKRKENSECINCGACQKVCPYKINVKKCYMSNIKNCKCIGCGLCDYVCPSKIELKRVLWGDKYED